MCGITGFFDTSASLAGDTMQRIVVAMADALRHRGPDDTGMWVDEAAGVALGHRRLSIIDLSPAGHQPMVSPCGRYVIVYNGEVYNFPDLKGELERRGSEFRGESDTEVILAAMAEWGIEEAVGRLNGMFAFVLWDRQERELYLVRDRVGIKPLYYGWVGKVFLFGSELKALRRFPKFPSEVDRDSLCLLLRHNYIPAPRTIYRGFHKLEPGYLLRVTARGDVEEKRYWSLERVVGRALSDPFRGSEEEAEEALDTLLRDAVRCRMVSDVPLGAFLSGGIDSSTVVALMQAQSDRPVRTFSIGFHESGYNEAVYARWVAEHLGTDHTELYVTPKEAMEVIPSLPEIYDEPFSDSSQVPTYLVSKLTRNHVTVSLSGDGGDELFAGYNRYFWGHSIWRKIGWIPKVVRRKVLSRGLRRVSPASWDRLFHKISPVLPDKLRQVQPGDKLHKLAEILDVDSADELYFRLVSHWKNPGEVIIGGVEPLTILREKRWEEIDNFIPRMQFLDLMTYLPDDILAKVDRASMAVSLEARVPLLDHRVVEFAWRIPLAMKIKKGKGKWLLRQVLSRYLPSALVERPKMGFGVPLDAWLRGPLRDWAEALLEEHRLLKEGFFKPEPIRRKWKEHLSGKRNWHYYLWDILMFQAWLEKN